MRYHYNAIVREKLRALLGAKLDSVKPVILPYESRNIDRMISRLQEAIASIEGRQALVAVSARGLRPMLYVCEAKTIVTRVKNANVADELSGLKHGIPVMEVVFEDEAAGGCTMKPVWRRSRLVLEEGLLEKCGSCRRLVL